MGKATLLGYHGLLAIMYGKWFFLMKNGVACLLVQFIFLMKEGI
jgi:hypothetical protein